MKNYCIVLFILSLLLIISACEPAQMYHTLTLMVEPEGAGNVTPDGGKYEHGRQLILTAENNTGFIFKHWQHEDNELVTGHFCGKNPCHPLESFACSQNINILHTS